MSERDLGREMQLADISRQLEEEKQRIGNINQKISEGVDFEEERKLEARKDSSFQKISELDNKKKALEQADEQRHLSESARQLADILQTADDSKVQQAYQGLAAYWHTAIPATMPPRSQLVTELDRLGNSKDADYSGLESFIAHLWQVANGQLLIELKRWSQTYYPARDWANLYQTIQAALLDSAKSFKPAILVKVAPAEEKTTQSAQNQPHYRLEAWLIEDIHTYKTQGRRRTGYRPLIKAETPDAEPFVLDKLTQKVQSLLGQWIKRTKQLLMDCEEDPEFYVFLPKELLDMAVDDWPLSAALSLGHAYSVVLCCLDRIDGPYPVKGWKQYWTRHTSAAERVAREVFVESDGSDVSAVMAAIAQMKASADAVGLHLTCAPGAETLSLIVEELLIAGVPLFFWGRCDEVNISNAEALDTILQKDSLGNLAETVQLERSKARLPQNTPECHIGHHLSFLRDSPLLIYPLST